MTANYSTMKALRQEFELYQHFLQWKQQSWLGCWNKIEFLNSLLDSIQSLIKLGIIYSVKNLFLPYKNYMHSEENHRIVMTKLNPQKNSALKTIQESPISHNSTDQFKLGMKKNKEKDTHLCY